jgi:hypothetical protein
MRKMHFLCANSLYSLLLHFAYTRLCLMAKTSKNFRFDPSLYGDFKKVASASGFTVTDAFERFMSGCVEAGKVVFVEKAATNYATEARVLVDWLGKGKLFYRSESGEEINISARLLSLLPKVHDVALKKTIEGILKKSVKEQTD